MFSQACVNNSVHRGEVYTPRTDTTPTPRQTATATDGTHPTGMHSCYLLCYADTVHFCATMLSCVFQILK